jgi:hypothetical protein
LLLVDGDPLADVSIAAAGERLGHHAERQLPQARSRCARAPGKAARRNRRRLTPFSALSGKLIREMHSVPLLLSRLACRRGQSHRFGRSLTNFRGSVAASSGGGWYGP